MAARRNRGPKAHKFSDKLLLNQWLVGLFGIDPLRRHSRDGRAVRPFRVLSEPIKDPRLEGLAHDNLHLFYHELVGSNVFWSDTRHLSRDQLLAYEENIAGHTRAINERRERPIVWKYFQWLTLIFAEIYLDRYYGDRLALRNDLNDFVKRFNRRWTDYADVPEYGEDDLNKLCGLTPLPWTVQGLGPKQLLITSSSRN